ncbi:MAG TPA: hypothetical protein VFN67_23035 [Polyangiales bacterium]|nr:hypothetical protein [Polyangiales bacterium]
METSSIIIGGIVPAVCLGLGTVLMRASIDAGASIPAYLAVVGTTVASAGWGAILLGKGSMIGLKPAVLASLMGLTWSAAISCIAYGFGTLKLPVSVVAPLTNSNALVAVLVGAIAFSEWKALNMTSVAIGTALICTGATVISLSR